MQLVLDALAVAEQPSWVSHRKIVARRLLRSHVPHVTTCDGVRTVGGADHQVTRLVDPRRGATDLGTPGQGDGDVGADRHASFEICRANGLGGPVPTPAEVTVRQGA